MIRFASVLGALVLLVLLVVASCGGHVRPETCGNGRHDRGEQCDPSVPNESCCTKDCEIAKIDVVCRASAGGCDVADSCDGASSKCPDDVFLGVGFVCRQSRGSCDLTESCSGMSAACPSDQLAAPGSICSTGFGDADAGMSPSGCRYPGACSGSSADCPLGDPLPLPYFSGRANRQVSCEVGPTLCSNLGCCSCANKQLCIDYNSGCPTTKTPWIVGVAANNDIDAFCNRYCDSKPTRWDKLLMNMARYCCDEGSIKVDANGLPTTFVMEDTIAGNNYWACVDPKTCIEYYHGE